MNKYILKAILWLVSSLALSIYATTYDLTDIQAFAVMYAIWFSGVVMAYLNYENYKQSKKVTRWHD